MKKVIIIGCPGGGKSTFARALADKTGLPLYHLDMLYWNADKTTVGREAFRERLAEVMAGDEWIIDGNYISTMQWRMECCDTVFFLDMPLEVSSKMMTSRYKGDDSKRDIHEKDREYLAKCRAAASFAAKKCGWNIIDCSRDGEPRTIEDISAEIMSFVKSIL